jgi:uncharacterized protein (TIGR00251 family)
VARALPIAPAPDGVTVTVKLTPRARQAGIDGVAEEPAADGPRPVLKARVTAPPEDGKANAALIALLAKSWRLPKSAFTIVAGDTSRLKRIRITGATQDLLRHITAKIEAA